ncbi:hypothetical protein B9Z65_4112 [Elsinoe australis]|uniref:N-acetyltransferase domain-containing protein n=1 Tax=Elsinoe australis TaxID=40998 RepID=A0A2P7Z1W9_9PEZI|nr:hypothetical protein B9Z65_4112 [Elsinoe australis]
MDIAELHFKAPQTTAYHRPTPSPSKPLTMIPAPFTIYPATTPHHLSQIHTLFTAYATSLGHDLSFQSFATELSTLPGAYSPPDGRLFLALSPDSTALGCVGLRPLPTSASAPFSSSSANEPTNSSAGESSDRSAGSPVGKTAEMKRLYVVPSARGTGLGKALALAAIRAARDEGYSAVKLDTLREMKAARSMYEGLGFRECGQYYETPLEGTVFMELDLRDWGEGEGGEEEV